MKDKEIITWEDPADKKMKYFALSSTNGHYWSEDPDDPLIVDVSRLPIKHTIEDTLRHVAEKYKMQKGKQYERFDLFHHPDPKIHAYLTVEKLPDGTRDKETGKVNRSYQSYFSHKFKLPGCISRVTGKGQGNPSMRKKGYAQELAQKSKEERKRRLASAQETARKLQFDPMKRLALYAMGDSERLGLKEDVKQSIQMKALETYLKYSHQQLKPYSPQEIDKLRADNSGPKINVILPSDGSEVKGTVLEHKSQESLDQYLSSGRYSYVDIDEETNEYDNEYENVKVQLPDQDEYS